MVAYNPFKPDPRLAECDKARLVNLCLGSHEFLLLVIEAWAAEVVVRYGLDEMFDIQWTLWSEKVLPAIREMKGRWMNITTNDVRGLHEGHPDRRHLVPGQGLQADLRDARGRRRHHDLQPVLRARPVGGARSTRHPREELPLDVSGLVDRAGQDTYNPNMKVDILAIPPRVSSENVCCKWKLSMRDESDPEYVPVELGTKPGKDATDEETVVPRLPSSSRS